MIALGLGGLEGSVIIQKSRHCHRKVGPITAFLAMIHWQ